jgi:hypothetical protein
MKFLLPQGEKVPVRADEGLLLYPPFPYLEERISKLIAHAISVLLQYISLIYIFCIDSMKNSH